MSGGVDSTVTACLLVRAGYDVAGVTLQLADLGTAGLSVSRCCSHDDMLMARAVCERIGIPHRVVELSGEFRRAVVEPFVESYLAGETPLPCAACNAKIKFGELLDLARELGAESLATGHYARVGREGDAVVLRRGRDRGKDQSYFLFALKPAQLERLELPLGELTKREVRAVAAELGLPNAAKPESQDVCFLPEEDSYVKVLEALASDRLPGEGELVDRGGRVLGRHDGYHRFTVGQRRGLGLAGGRRLYVLSVHPDGNRVVVGGREETLRRRLVLRDVNWLAPEKGPAVDGEVQVRSKNQPSRATFVLSANGSAEVEFVEPIASPAPGQAAVCYEGDRLLGGGWIVSTE